MTLHTVFVSNIYGIPTVSKRIGTTKILLGDNLGSYSNANSVVWAELYDGGFFPIGTTYNGRYLTFRRIHLSAALV